MTQTSNTSPSNTWDAQLFFTQLDNFFAEQATLNTIDNFLLQALYNAQNSKNISAEITILNEILGFYRSQGKHAIRKDYIERAEQLCRTHYGVTSQEYVTTLINIATSYRVLESLQQAETTYRKALNSALQIFPRYHRTIAALMNNMAMLYTDTQRYHLANTALNEALQIMEHNDSQPEYSQEIATTVTNIAIVQCAMQHYDTAQRYAEQACQIYSARLQRSQHTTRQQGVKQADELATNVGHYAGALASLGQVLFCQGKFENSLRHYQKALPLLIECYGETSDAVNQVRESIAIIEETQHNAQDYKSEIHSNNTDHPDTSQSTREHNNALPLTSSTCNNNDAGADAMCQSGIALARQQWVEYRKALENDFPELLPRIAAGLAGHGSECYGFDDTYSRDHDFGNGFCIWLTDDDFDRFGNTLQKHYQCYASKHHWNENSPATPRASGSQSRRGVMSISSFFEGITGYSQAPDSTPQHHHAWLLLDDVTLAAATNGSVFADPLGAFSHARQQFKLMPEDVRLARISRALAMMSQAGQYNLQRCYQRHNIVAFNDTVHEFLDATIRLVFLMNSPVTVGYPPYYKWRFVAFERLCSRMGMVLTETLNDYCIIVKETAALCASVDPLCTDTAATMQNESNAIHYEQISEAVERICTAVVDELLRQGLTTSHETFLEWQRPYIEEHIHDPWLQSIHP